MPVRILSILLVAVVSGASYAGNASVVNLMRQQSPVKSQGTVGSCSMFSTIALLEYKLRKLGYTGGQHVDLSEQYVLYTVAGQKGYEGSKTPENVKALDTFGFVTEQQWAFGREPWYKIKNYNALPGLAKARCGHLRGTNFFDGCLIGQRDPRLLEATDQALLDRSSPLYDPEFKELRDYAESSATQFKIRAKRVRSKSSIIRLLNSGEPLVMDLRNFYEAWNRTRASQVNGLHRDMDMFYRGIVSYPHKDSLDVAYKAGLDYKTGHSILLLGYDPNVVISRKVKSRTGKVIDVTRRGAFYFKNSWGTWGFGKDFTLGGQTFPGYGMVSADYALEHGSFYQVTVNGK